ncbi:MAG TPA: GNAT family N-acetyltransferase [Bryobacteraceae bacterium]|nr:GNAT family N-acetyltransferase [Bryobacteraceae bacterium]
MAAAPDRFAPELVDLTRIALPDLEELLREECMSWRTALHWDFEPSAELVRRFVRIHALSGYALVLAGRVVGYGYYVCEDGKGLIGDLYLIRAFDTAANAGILLSALLGGLFRTPGIRRIEAQMMLVHGAFDRTTPYSRYAQAFSRVLMLAETGLTDELPAHDIGSHRLLTWDSALHDEAAMAIASSYQGHVDARINDQYRTWLGARRFLANVIQYPGCGVFQESASLLAVDADDRVKGVVLSSVVAQETGHITQICVTPEVRGTGLGYELLRHALASLSTLGCAKASLTVTASNTEAIRLYQRVGFRSARRFSAYVWEGF